MKPQLRLYDTMRREKVPVRTPEPGRPLTLYVCGPTVYGRAHIGNARPAVVFDVLYRLLRHLHGKHNVRYARNFTDIDDKIMARAVAENRTPQAVAAEYEAAYLADMDALGCLRPDFMPRATEHVEGPHGMIAMIGALVARGFAYAAEDHVLFEVARFDRYGALSRRPMDEMIAGARVDVAPYKRAPGDFVLWKPSAPDQPGWNSPWGRGRPGWHIECSAMIRSVLETETIDIHGGGLDLIFPHHENEIAQSCCAHGTDSLARIWMHNGFVQMGETKMSKSLGNIVTPRELLDAGWQGEVIRLALLSAHYRQPLVWTDALLAQSKARLAGLQGAHVLQAVEVPLRAGPDNAAAEAGPLMDDLGTPEMLATLSRLRGEQHWQALRDSLSLLGLSGLGLTPDAIDSEWEAHLAPSIRHYREARAARDWATADSIRDRLAAEGIQLSVAKDGRVSWRRA